jgi:hypothetical protein
MDPEASEVRLALDLTSLGGDALAEANVFLDLSNEDWPRFMKDPLLWKSAFPWAGKLL